MAADTLPIQTVILVHGAWADGSSWSSVVPTLQNKGLNVVAVQLPLSSLADDAAVVQRAIELADGPLLLVGHSYGGAVISEAGDHAKVLGLVYVAAFAPDVGEFAFSLGALVPPSPASAQIRPDKAGYLKLTSEGVIEDFAQDLPEEQKRTMVATQGPTSIHSLSALGTHAAWHTKPSWYVLAESDRTIPPELQDIMSSKIGATVKRVPASHVVMLSHPSEVASTIVDAARSFN